MLLPSWAVSKLFLWIIFPLTILFGQIMTAKLISLLSLSSLILPHNLFLSVIKNPFWAKCCD
jgi:hypothetical protein